MQEMGWSGGGLACHEAGWGKDDQHVERQVGKRWVGLWQGQLR